MPRATEDGMKICSVCRENLSIDSYGPDKRASDKLRNECNMCRKTTGKKYRSKPGYREAQAERVRDWNSRNSEHRSRKRREWHEQNKESVRVKNARYYQENKDRVMARTLRWREANREKYNAAIRNWHLANRERDAVHASNRRARKRELPAEKYTVKQIIERDGTRCALTGILLNVKEREFTIDHLVPIMVDMEWYNSIEPHAPHPGDQLGNVRLADGRANSGRNNRMTLLDHCELQAKMPCWFTRSAIEQHYA